MWDETKREEVTTPKKISDFFDELEALYRKYDLSIGHEDEHGGFKIERFSHYNLRWIRGASLNVKE